LFSIIRALKAVTTCIIEVVVFYTYAVGLVQWILNLIQFASFTSTVNVLKARVAFTQSRISWVLNRVFLARGTNFIYRVKSISRIAQANLIFFYGSFNTLVTFASTCSGSAQIITFSAFSSILKIAFLAHAISGVGTSMSFAHDASVRSTACTERVTFHTLSLEFPEAIHTAAFTA